MLSKAHKSSITDSDSVSVLNHMNMSIGISVNVDFDGEVFVWINNTQDPIEKSFNANKYPSVQKLEAKIENWIAQNRREGVKRHN
jgi:hypothetical protein